jgi:opacity protein-like surface antigen
VIAAVMVMAVLVPSIAAADSIDPVEQINPPYTGWQLRFYFGAVDMHHDSDAFNRPASSRRGFDNDVGGGVGFNAEYRFSRRLGIDLGVFSGAEVDVDAPTYRTGHSSWVTHDTLTFTPLTMGLDIHLTPDSRVDLYACPQVALVHYGRWATTHANPDGFIARMDFDEDIALGATLGLGLPLGKKRWSLQAMATYIDSSLEGSGRDGLRISSGYNSTIFGFGFGYRFNGGKG